MQALILSMSGIAGPFALKPKPRPSSLASRTLPLPYVRAVGAVSFTAISATEDIDLLEVIGPRQARGANHTLAVGVDVARSGRLEAGCQMASLQTDKSPYSATLKLAPHGSDCLPAARIFPFFLSCVAAQRTSYCQVYIKRSELRRSCS